MHVRPMVKVLAGLAAIALLVGVVGAPAGAGQILATHLQIDTLHFYAPSIQDPDNPCGTGPNALTASLLAMTFDITALHAEGAVELSAGDWWYLEIDHLGTITTGTVTGSAITGLDIALGFSLVDVDDDDCTPISSPCSGVFGLVLDGSLATFPSGTVAVLAGDSPSSTIGGFDIQITSCGSAAATYQGEPVTAHHLIAYIP